LTEPLCFIDSKILRYIKGIHMRLVRKKLFHLDLGWRRNKANGQRCTSSGHQHTILFLKQHFETILRHLACFEPLPHSNAFISTNSKIENAKVDKPLSHVALTPNKKKKNSNGGWEKQLVYQKGEGKWMIRMGHWSNWWERRNNVPHTI
jgi:hypothetical protein